MSYETSGVVLETGITAAIQAGTTGPQMNVAGFRIGSLSATDGIVAETTDTDVDGFVFAGDTSMLTYNQVDQDTIVWIITLPVTVGDFPVGNICVTLAGGANLVKAVLPGASPKYKSNPPTVVGNTKVYNIVMHLSNAAGIINLSVLNANVASLPEVPTEADLPDPLTTPYNTYLVRNHTHAGIPVVAIRLNDTWNFAPHFLYPGVGSAVVAVASGMFDAAGIDGSLPAVTTGVVGWNPTSMKFVAGDPANDASQPAGMRISAWQVMTVGQILGSVVGLSGTLTPGTSYYCDVGSNAGHLTSTANGSAPVAIAVSVTDVWVDMSGMLLGASGNSISTEEALLDVLAALAQLSTEMSERRATELQFRNRPWMWLKDYTGNYVSNGY